MSDVLIVEDDAWQADQLTRQLERAGHQVQAVPHALAAIDAIDQQTPDVILLDMMLPGANGMTLLHELRSHADLADIPVIVCSTTDVSPDTLRPYGVQAVLDKSTMTNDDVVRSVARVAA